ncbi:MAG: phosphate signaling complex protein PhoU [Microbacteriaceae bacterium]|nr:phosphate signaling complex protein PhoU [Microbacteriaceae bacterium]
MRIVFQQELSDVQAGLVEIAELVTTAIEGATRAFTTSDVTLAQLVIENDKKIDDLALSLDEKVTDILARQQPVASDLRLMVSALRMSSSLERMADLAQHIAELARYRYPTSAIPAGFEATFERMGQLDVEMARLTVQLLQRQEVETIEKLRSLDDELDSLHSEIFTRLLSERLEKAENVVDSTLASRYHERFGDHAVSISKQLNYFLSGHAE